ncbi:hypothetical protein A2366_01185 [Candidatus Woesebacteria bacterium RIFOXYB1_FULL_33_9]|nr:MAG: hypothetical protein A2366_01185 [Candidatus Woesebacteria bacterium RIFOXYB1_FULL_33_9]
MNFMEKRMKKMKWFDVSLAKLTVAAGIIFIFKLIPGGWNWVNGVSTWWFLVLMIIFATRPFYLYFKK